MPRLFSSAAMPRSDVVPAARNASTVRAMSAARWRARSAMTARPMARASKKKPRRSGAKFGENRRTSFYARIVPAIGGQTQRHSVAKWHSKHSHIRTDIVTKGATRAARACRAWYGPRAQRVVRKWIEQLARAGDHDGVKAWSEVANQLTKLQTVVASALVRRVESGTAGLERMRSQRNAKSS
jgi:hypothetical protein